MKKPSKLFPFINDWDNVVLDERDNIISKNEQLFDSGARREVWIIEHCLTPFKNKESIEIIQRFQENPCLETRVKLAKFICNCVFRFNHKTFNDELNPPETKKA